MNKIQIKNITKKYNNLTALDDVSFSFEFGKIYGLLGRNGAGKSTLINIIANRIFADEGMILVDDIPAKENMQVHEKVFCMSEADLYDKDFENNERTIIIATHLIEEVTNIIEEVVLIDHGKIILQDTVESLLETGYSVSGISHEVDQYCSDKNVIGHDELGNMKIAYILDNKTSIPPDSSLHFSSMNLQKLFVKLTEKGGK